MDKITRLNVYYWLPSNFKGPTVFGDVSKWIFYNDPGLSYIPYTHGDLDLIRILRDGRSMNQRDALAENHTDEIIFQYLDREF